jgi:hypothetical protein
VHSKHFASGVEELRTLPSYSTAVVVAYRFHHKSIHHRIALPSPKICLTEPCPPPNAAHTASAAV